MINLQDQTIQKIRNNTYRLYRFQGNHSLISYKHLQIKNNGLTINEFSVKESKKTNRIVPELIDNCVYGGGLGINKYFLSLVKELSIILRQCNIKSKNISDYQKNFF
jgi:hypothetical protein